MSVILVVITVIELGVIIALLGIQAALRDRIGNLEKRLGWNGAPGRLSPHQDRDYFP